MSYIWILDFEGLKEFWLLFIVYYPTGSDIALVAAHDYAVSHIQDPWRSDNLQSQSRLTCKVNRDWLCRAIVADIHAEMSPCSRHHDETKSRLICALLGSQSRLTFMCKMLQVLCMWWPSCYGAFLCKVHTSWRWFDYPLQVFCAGGDLTRELMHACNVPHIGSYPIQYSLYKW